MQRRLAQVRAEPTDPREWPPVSRWENDVHYWLNRNPVSCEGLVQTMLGAPMPVYHGGLLHAQVSYYDEEAARPGLPHDVAALVEQVDAQGVVVQLINLNPLRRTVVQVQGGAFGEHRLTQITDLASGESTALDSRTLRVELAPGAGLRARLALQRFAGTPAYLR